MGPTQKTAARRLAEMAKVEKSSRFVSVDCCLDEFAQHQENKNT